MSKKNTESQKIEAIKRNRERAILQKAQIKERIRLSNILEAKGLPPDEWVVNYRIKNYTNIQPMWAKDNLIKNRHYVQ